MLKAPLERARPYPVTIDTEPPVPLADEVLPEERLSLPPAASFPAPEAIRTLPAKPLLEVPERKMVTPLEPPGAFPDPKVIEPLTPPVLPAFQVPAVWPELDVHCCCV